jgi:type VII secretion protein EccB
MAKPPVTRMQLDAYRFGQRRLESALALRDPVLLHEQIRGQRRIVATGLILALLVACGLLAYIHLSHKDGWVGKSIILNSRSGQMYVVIHQPDRLVPVPNLAAGRLVLAAASDPKSGLTGLAGGSDTGHAEPQDVDPQQLLHAPVTPTSALYGAPGVNLPGADTPAAEQRPWALCDDTRARTTTVLDGIGATSALGPRDGVVVANQGDDYLLTGNKAYKIQPGAAAAYDLKDAMVSPPPIADNVLALIPKGPELRPLILNVGGRGATSGGSLGNGDVVRVNRPGEGGQYYVVAQGRLALVSGPVAQLLRIGAGQDVSQPAPVMSLDQSNAYPHIKIDGLDGYPQYVPRMHPGAVLCWQWGDRGANPTLSTADTIPAPANQPITQLAQADGAGPGLDSVSLPSGVAINVSAVPGADPSARQGYWLVAPNGVAYPIADTRTAQALGLSDPILAPVDALNALVQGPPLSYADATRTVDVYRQTPATGGG